MSNLKQVFVLFLTLSASTAFGARWTCEATCFLFLCGTDNTESSTYEITTYGSSQLDARNSAIRQCENSTVGSTCRISKIGDPIVCSEAAPPPPKHYKIVYKNNCRKHGEIWTAIHSVNMNGDWEVRGYWNIAYGESKVVALTKNRIFEFHGHTRDNVVWGSGSNLRTIHKVAKPFSTHEINSGSTFGTYTFTFGCD